MALHFLHLEDSADDADLIHGELRRAGLDAQIDRVETRDAFLEALFRRDFDLIISDYNLPAFDGLSALRLARERCPEVPFILVSSTIGEEKAVAALHEGAADYVMKDRIIRLPAAVERALCDARDLAILQETEQKLKEAYDRQSLLMSSIPVAMYYARIGPPLEMVWISDTVERITGFPVRRFIEEPNLWTSRLHYADRGQVFERFGSIADRGSVEMEYRWQCADGWHWFYDRAAAIQDRKKDPPAIVGIWLDISEKKTLQEQVVRAQRMESIGALASGVAHDLNNVLTPILMGIEILKENVHDEGSARILSSLGNSARRGAGVVKQVLAFARGTAGERVSLQPRHVIREVEKIIEQTFPKNIQFKTDVPKDLWEILADPTQLHQVLLNLCINARDAMPQGGALSIHAENRALDERAAAKYDGAKPSRYAAISVSDTGTGIEPAVLSKIFDPFFTTKPPGQGTGLGLSTVMNIVKAHEGFVSVDSEAGRGSRFTIHLPAAKVAVAEASAPESAAPQGHGEGILIADDEASIREITRETLEAHGYRVFAAADGTEAVALYVQHAPEIGAVLADVGMPYMDGFALARALRKVNPAVKLIFVTGMEQHAERAWEAGARGFLLKPYSGETLLRTLCDVLDAGV